ncbi:hypothetical protein [Streptomyces sp. NBC_00078]|uniref:hypothetical protein n=1 Tax=unclassified Streptomyces TaxID=2593676 RepID=UPI002252D408|nr:hypothetical protein [Streptomyces sp. NBC_00078]MCX5423998.1 hypothetical protein [Streptomyces sp. NBC_00078]
MIAQTVTFVGTWIDVITETNTDEGTIAVSLDGASQGTVNANATSRHVQQTVYTVSGLTAGRHTLTLTKNSGAFMVIDRFDVKSPEAAATARRRCPCRHRHGQRLFESGRPED